MSLIWSDEAFEDLLRLSPAEAEVVDRAVQRWEATGEGMVLAAGPSEFRLFADRFVVVFFLDGGVMHVAQVRVA